MTRTTAPTNMAMFQAVLLWIVAYWLVEIARGHAMTLGVATLVAVFAMLLAMISVNQAVAKPSPFSGTLGRLLWVLRPRAWMIAWSLIVAVIAILGRPMILNWYGGGRCQYIDWWLRAHTLPAHGDGLFQGCRFLVGW